jgi:hypothetical protein
MAFDYPNAAALAGHLLGEASVGGTAGQVGQTSKEAEIREALASIPLARLRRAGLIDPLLRLTGADDGEAADSEPEQADLVASAGVEELIRMTADGSSAASNEGEGTQ